MPKPDGAKPASQQRDAVTVNIPELDLRAAVRADSVDEDARTVELVFTKGARVKRRVWTDYGVREFYEELEVSEQAIRMDRLNNGAPFLNTHMRWNTDDVLGVVEKAWIDGEEGRAVVRFSKREEAEKVWNDVKDGILRNVSVGYLVHRYEVDEEQSDLPVHRAIDWEPIEISVVPVGADGDAGFRAQEKSSTCVLTRADAQSSDKETDMPKPNGTQAGDQARNAAADANAAPDNQAELNARGAPNSGDEQRNAPDNGAEARRAIAEERQRAEDIRAVGVKLRIAETDIAKAVKEGLTIDQVRARFIDLMADRDDANGSDSETRGQARIIRDEVDTRRSAVENAVLHRMAPSQNELSDAGREFRGMSLLEIGRSLQEARGVSTRGMSRMELAGAMVRSDQSTSDFPYILANVANKRLRMAYEAAPRTFLPIVNETTQPDFKTVSVNQIGQAPALLEIPEGAEYKTGTFGESREQYALVTYGRVVRMTRQMIINDDLNAFARILTGFGAAAANLESDIVWGIICTNAALADGTALFHADHGNLASAGAISVTNLGAARALMRKQTALDGATLLNLEPRYLAVPAELETVALQYTRQTSVVSDPANQNVYANSMDPIVEPRLASLSGGSANDWYLFADPARIDTIEVARLEGEAGVQTEMQQSFETDGVAIKARNDFAAKAIDHRGMVKNPGS
jgi:hypothetical protein